MATPNFLPILDNVPSAAVVSALSRLSPLLVPSSHVPVSLPDHPCLVLVESISPPPDLEKITNWLNAGAEKVVVESSVAKDLLDHIPANRLVLLLDIENVSSVSDKMRSGVSGVLLRTSSTDPELLSSIRRFFPNSDFYVQVKGPSKVSSSHVRDLKQNGYTLCIPTSQLTLEPTSSTHLNIADAFLAPLSSDRPDNLFPTIVSSHLDGERSLGLVYSSTESVKESITSGKGVYQSRKHGLWRKGETSGSSQDIVRITVDCDSDCLQYSVIQHGSGFCHLGTTSCFGGFQGLAALERTLRSRMESAPAGSYTRRLLEDTSLLSSKIREEADELCRAETQEQIAFEASDLIYFALTKCVSKGVSIADIEAQLDKKAKKVTRRPGNAKPDFKVPSAPEPTYVAAPPSGKISMRRFSLKEVSPAERQTLLRRPVINSSLMIAKVRPIIEDVRQRGDQALIDLTAKFDKAVITSTVLLPPFSAASGSLSDDVRTSIDRAYANIRAFHEAQTSEPLTVETIPGVVCSRFARPIERVGLYVPGGTAVLPSTALMLGIPAQVAGCKQIVLATPPRADGSIVPEVMYVAHLVGASAIVKAGGAQAIAALAYGTETVPKVDKIFGPGNQWVTAAKMSVQNDTDALVSIDMPAGPSEVLVIADSTANPAFVAADLLSQAEHGIDSQVVLVAVNLSDERIEEIEREVDAQAHGLPRVDILRESVAKSLIVAAGSLQEAIDFSNDYAPEHLILQIDDAQNAVPHIQNAGSIFVGPYTPESCGDYASGTNHTLPTNGYARQFSGVNTQSFQKHITSQHITKEGLLSLGPTVVILADCEGLQAHANAVRIRLAQL